jgi:predicted transcriptional regulator
MKELADLLGRTQETLRQGYISAMVENGQLRQKYPSKHHPRQAYRASEYTAPEYTAPEPSESS